MLSGHVILPVKPDNVLVPPDVQSTVSPLTVIKNLSPQVNL
jgi:hypothetical protein